MSGSSSGKELTTEGRDWSASPREALSKNTGAHFYKKRKGMPSHLERRALKGKEMFKRDREILIRRMGHSVVRNMKQQHLPSGTGSIQSTGSLVLSWRREKPEH